ncbi:hypothetical protein MNEG_3967 [Monoraphidium neglectum]|uniref:Uncharacterized protein n=1 Tax=Monoraphidium neglectum TaxID=145388 RepID=A0A0D2LB59_9CHLO|nr:hypothetical protein MNEG_3967 [Monoraphidium neglectum]KIZ03994.1 hypothetical protein MNEG_3967 [Monoraphidium neglectum]|eukprot:XP_013903013.1 hypothetical protein MNEG_3967 [Monoraphidium neglectum]
MCLFSCSHHHPDVVAQNALLLAHRLALIEALEGPAASAHAAQAAGLPFRAQAASPNERDGGGGRDASAAAAQEEGLDQLVARAKAARLAQLLHQGSQRGGAPAAQAGAASRRLAAAPAAAAAPIRIRPVFQLDGVPPKPAARITNEIIPTAIAAIRKFVRVKAKGAAPQEAPRPFDGRQSCLASIPGAAPDPAKAAEGSHPVRTTG